MPQPRTPSVRTRWTSRALLVAAALLLPFAAPAVAGAAEVPALAASGLSGPARAAGLEAAAPATQAEPAGTADDVAEARLRREQAEGQLAAFQARVDEATRVLTEGSTRLAEKQAELARLQAEEQRAVADAERAVARADLARAHLRTVVAAAYRSPVPDAMQMALTTSPDGIRDAVVARADLARVRGSSQDLLREATAARVQADRLVRRADQLTEQAAEQQRQVAAEVERLRAYAHESEVQLQQAAAELAAARAAEQAASDDAAARAAAATAARAAAEAARAAALSGTGVLALCTDVPYTAQSNGFLAPATLCPLEDAPGEALRPDAAAAFNALNAAHKAERGQPLCVTDSYRSYAAQVDVYARKPHLAAVPGTSNHGWGLAVDFGCGVERFGSDAHTWMRVNAGRFGWLHPEWAQAGGSRPEAWHWEYAGTKG